MKSAASVGGASSGQLLQTPLECEKQQRLARVALRSEVKNKVGSARQGVGLARLLKTHNATLQRWDLPHVAFLHDTLIRIVVGTSHLSSERCCRSFDGCSDRGTSVNGQQVPDRNLERSNLVTTVVCCYTFHLRGGFQTFVELSTYIGCVH